MLKIDKDNKISLKLALIVEQTSIDSWQHDPALLDPALHDPARFWGRICYWALSDLALSITGGFFFEPLLKGTKSKAAGSSERPVLPLKHC